MTSLKKAGLFEEVKDRLDHSGTSLSGSDWMGIRTTDASVLKGVVRVPLFGGTIGAAAFLALFVLLLMPGLTWYREGR